MTETSEATKTTETAGVDMGELKLYLAKKTQIQELNEVVTRLRAEMAPIEQRLVDQFALSGVQNISVDGSTCYIAVDKYANAKKEYRPQLVAWARDNNLEDMIVLQPASFKSWCKECIAADGQLPAEISEMVNLFEKVNLRVRKA